MRTLLVALTLVVAVTIAGPTLAAARAAGACADTQPFVQIVEGLGAWLVGACSADPTTDPDGSVHQQAEQGVLSRYAGAPYAVFREPTRLWIDGPGGFGGDVRVVVPASAAGDRLEAHRRTSALLDRAALDEPTMPMGWESLPALTGRTGPASACQPGNEDLVLGRIQSMFGDERGQVRVVQGISGLRDGTGPEAMARIRQWISACPEWQVTAGGQSTTFKLTERRLQPLGEESIRYTVEVVDPSGSLSFNDTVVVRYGDLLISHGFLLTSPDQIKDGDLVGISELAERKLRVALR